jgi:hypothetical protein
MENAIIFCIFTVALNSRDRDTQKKVWAPFREKPIAALSTRECQNTATIQQSFLTNVID